MTNNTMNFDLPVNGATGCNHAPDTVVTGIDAFACSVRCLNSTSSVDSAGDFRITRRLECVGNGSDANFVRIIDLEISGAPGTNPVITLDGRLLSAAAVSITPGGIVEIRDLNGVTIDRIRIPVDATPSPAGSDGSAGRCPDPTTNVTDEIPVSRDGCDTPSRLTAPGPILGITVRPASGELVHHVAVDAVNVCVIDEVLTEIVETPAHEALH